MTLRLSTHQTVDIVTSDPDSLVVETTYQPGGTKPPAHYHPQQEELFQIEEGELRVELDGDLLALVAGETLTVEKDSVHRMWNAGTEVAKARWETRPALETEQWFREVDRLQASAEADGRSRPDPLAFASMASRHRRTFRLVIAGPKPLGDVVIRVLGAIGRVLGR